MSATRKPRRVMPLRIRIPAIVVGVFVLTWMMRGGASVVVNGIVDAIRPIDRTISGAAERAAAKTFAWLASLGYEEAAHAGEACDARRRAARR